jgi:NADP-dependent 3-hydroxy acid dehydrogenase YdfG
MNSHPGSEISKKGEKMSNVVLITGCSTGIGRDLADQLTKVGYIVVATARKMESLEKIQAALKLPLDVTQPESIKKAIENIIEKYGRIDVLINNAGYAQIGAIEEISDDQVQRMYDVNIFGVMRMIRAIVPYMRQQRSGRIINISSIAGKMTTPVNGTYSSTKFALEAMSDAMRVELESFNIQVILIEPGAIKTHFDQTVHTHGDAILTNAASPYLPLYRQYQQVSDSMRKQEPGPEVVTKAVRKALETIKPKARYLAGVSFPTMLVLHMRDLVWDLAVRQLFKISSRE